MFTGKNIVITGGSSGLGLALATSLAAQGANLGLVARNGQKLANAAAELQTGFPQCRIATQAADVSDETAMATCMERFAGELGGIDVLINNAGILREGYFETLPTADFREVMEINYFGQLIATRAALPYLKASQGRIVNIASMAGLTGAFGYTAYSSAKHALVGLTSCLYFELEPQGIKVHLVCPAEFDSPMVDELDHQRSPENRAHTHTIPKTGVDVIVDGTLKGIRADKFLIVPGKTTARIANLMRVFPAAGRLLGKRAIKRAMRNS